jgi:arginine decarboxylase
LLAQAFGADESFLSYQRYFIGTAGFDLDRLCNSGDKILVPRNMHKSMVAGVDLSGAKPVFLSPEVNEEFGIALGVTPVTKYRRPGRTHPEAKAALLINPTYYGTVATWVLWLQS